MFKSLYPSLCGENNIAPNTQIGRIEIPEKVYEDENYYHIEEEKYSRGGEFIENLVTDNIIEYCNRWFHLGSIEDIIEDIDECYNEFGYGQYSNLISAGFRGDGSLRSPILPTPKSETRQVVSFNNHNIKNPVIFYNSRDPKYNYNDLYKKG